MSSSNEIIDCICSSDDDSPSQVPKFLIVTFDEEPNPDIRIYPKDFCLDNNNIYFKLLPNNIDTLVFYAFFATHFNYFYDISYSYSLSLKSDNYNISSIQNPSKFSLVDSKFENFSVLLYYNNICLFDISNFFKRTAFCFKDSFFNRYDINKSNPFLLKKALIEILEFSYPSMYYDDGDEFIVIENANDIKTIIEKDNANCLDPKYYIFQAKTDFPFIVEISINFKYRIKRNFNFQLAWGIFEDKLIYIDQKENLFEFDLKKKKFEKKGKIQEKVFKNLVYACYGLKEE